MNFLSEFRRLVRRLEAADTDRKRKNARKKLKAFFRKVDRAYPALVNGKAVVRKGPPPCPYCKAVTTSWGRLGVHIAKHIPVSPGWGTGPPPCPCGYKAGGRKKWVSFGDHLYHVHKKEGLAVHLAKAKLAQSAKGNVP